MIVSIEVVKVPRPFLPDSSLRSYQPTQVWFTHCLPAWSVREEKRCTVHRLLYTLEKRHCNRVVILPWHVLHRDERSASSQLRFPPDECRLPSSPGTIRRAVPTFRKSSPPRRRVLSFLTPDGFSPPSPSSIFVAYGGIMLVSYHLVFPFDFTPRFAFFVSTQTHRRHVQ